MSNNTTTISKYLINKLKETGIDHVFGIPGDYAVNFFSEMEKSDIETVITCTEQGAAFAADSYSRLNGIGALCVTYCVGGLNTINAVAGAYAEKAPVVVISGAPGIGEYNNDCLLHHSIKHMDSQLNMFKEVTVSQAKLCDPHTAPMEIDRVINDCLKYKRPVYIELPRDMIHEECLVPQIKPELKPNHNPAVMKEALEEAVELVKKAKNPVIMGGVEIRRYKLEETFTELVEKTGYPYVTSFLGKSAINESHPQFAGVYVGKISDKNVQTLIEESDCVIILGALMTDMNLGTAQLNIAKTIYATADELSIKHHHYKGIDLEKFIKKLTDEIKGLKKKNQVIKTEVPDYKPEKDAPITISRVFERLNSFLPEKSTLVCDVGDSLFGSIELKIPKNSCYIGPAFYTSMGYAIPASLGVQVARPDYRPIVIVGDGAFQMTGQELSPIALLKLNPIVFVMNNHGYTTQRFLKDGSYNDINNWNYHRIPEVIGSGLGLEVNTEGELEVALDKALNNTDSFSIINVNLDKYDKSNTLLRLTNHFKKKV